MPRKSNELMLMAGVQVIVLDPQDASGSVMSVHNVLADVFGERRLEMAKEAKEVPSGEVKYDELAAWQLTSKEKVPPPWLNTAFGIGKVKWADDERTTLMVQQSLGGREVLCHRGDWIVCDIVGDLTVIRGKEEDEEEPA